MGRLTRDPDVRYANQGDRTLAIARYSLAVDRRKKVENGQNADFISCVAFDRGAEFAEKYLRKGTKVLVTGRLQTGSYINREGIKVYTTDVMVEEQEFAESRAASEPHPYGQQNYQAPPQNAFGAPQAPPTGPADQDGFMHIPEGVDDEGLPFN